MKINDDVILDLLPLYFEGEASEATRNLIETYFKENPGFEKGITKMYSSMKKTLESEINKDITVEFSPEEKMQILKKTKKMLKIRTSLLVTTILCIVIPMLVLTLQPTLNANVAVTLFFVMFLIAPLTLGGYFYLRHRMRVSGI